jgi:hypothetical protein
VFEGLFPASHDTIVQTLLYRFAQWHALAKLRNHSESTLSFLEDTFKTLSRQLRKFRDFTCAAFNTVELQKETAARRRRLAQRAECINATSSESSGPRTKRFNLNTYKFHAMGDYVRTIKLFGTTDSFTTQIVRILFPNPQGQRGTYVIGQGELAHRALKAIYPLMSKLDTPAQLAKHERRRHVLRQVREAADTTLSSNQTPADSATPWVPNDHHFIASSRNNPVSLFTFLQEHGNDPATKVRITLHF